MEKLNLDMAVLIAYLFKLNGSPFVNTDDDLSGASMSTAWLPVQEKHKSFKGEHDQNALGAEMLFDHLMNGKVPGLFQRFAEAMSLKPRFERSARRVANSKEWPQHPARGYDLTEIGFLITGVLYSGLTNRFDRLMEALDLPEEQRVPLQAFLRHSDGFRHAIDCAARVALDVLHGKKELTDVKTEDDVGQSVLVFRILKRIMLVNPLYEEMKDTGGKAKKADTNYLQKKKLLSQYLEEKFVTDCKRVVKMLLLVFRMGNFNLTPPLMRRTSSGSEGGVQLLLRWGIYSKVRASVAPTNVCPTRTFRGIERSSTLAGFEHARR